jgi:hypothetical protein
MRRIAIATILLAVLPFARAGNAAGCPLLTDPSGDESLYWTQPVPPPSPPNPDADIVSGDIASDRIRLTTVIRLRDLTASPLYAVAYSFRFFSGATEYDTFVSRSAQGVTAVLRRRVVRTVVGADGTAYQEVTTEQVATIAAVVDLVANEVRATVRLSRFPADRPRPGVTLTGLAVWTASRPDLPGVDTTPYADRTTGAATYVAGTAGCIPA